LREFQRGYPTGDLERLLKSEDDGLVAVGIWITSEMGVNSRPFLSEAARLLTRPVKKIRFWALDSLYWTLPEDGCNLAAAAQLLEDPETGIRWKVLDLLSRLSREQIEAAYLCSQRSALNPVHEDGLRWLLSSDSEIPENIKMALQSPDKLFRKYGVVAAARLRERDKEPLHFASTIDDSDVQNFANGLLTR